MGWAYGYGSRAPRFARPRDDGSEIHLVAALEREDFARVVGRRDLQSQPFEDLPHLGDLLGVRLGELARADLSSMRTLIANAAPVPYSLKQEFIAKLGDGFLYEVYGSTELGVVTVLPPEDQLRKPGSCGKTYGPIDVRIVLDDGTDASTGEAGELFIRSTLEMDGYHHTDERLTEHGAEWKSVGDVAYLDDEGYVYICDRKKDMIISGGVNIYPAEVEAVLDAHPDVADAAVIGVPDAEWGESVKAVVQLREGARTTADELIAFCAERLAGFKKPRSVDFVDLLPRDAAGKLLKRKIREPYWAGAGRRI